MSGVDFMGGSLHTYGVNVKQIDDLVLQDAIDWGGEEAFCVGAKKHPDHVERLAWIMEALSNTPGCILDVGSGSGYISHCLRQAGNKVVSLEASPRWMAFAKDRYPGEYVHGLAERLPFCDSTFGGVLLAEILEHVENPMRVLREAARVSARHSRLVATFPSTWHSIDEPDHVRFIDPTEGRQYLELAGYVIDGHASNAHFFAYFARSK
jgi:SAM-dependent methyltransferase